MIDTALIAQIHRYKEANGCTLHDLSRILDIQISTIARWLKTGRINKLYAQMVKSKLKLMDK